MSLHAQIETFGDVAAEEDDAILSYFVKTAAVAQIEDGEAIVVLGRKGSGKTALARYFADPRPGLLTTSLSLRDYPWGIHERRRNLGASEIEAYVSSWRYLIAVKALSLLISTYGLKPNTDAQRAANKFLHDNYGGANPALADILQPKKLKLSKSSFSPSIMGNSIGGVEFETDQGGVGPELDALTNLLVDRTQTSSTTMIFNSPVNPTRGTCGKNWTTNSVRTGIDGPRLFKFSRRLRQSRFSANNLWTPISAVSRRRIACRLKRPLNYSTNSRWLVIGGESGKAVADGFFSTQTPMPVGTAVQACSKCTKG